MRIRRVLVMAVLSATVWGCQNMDGCTGFADIHPGQTVAQVEQQLGKADQHTEEALVYVACSCNVVIPLLNGRVASEPAYVTSPSSDCYLKATTD